MTTEIALVSDATNGNDLAAMLGFNQGNGTQSALPELFQLYKAVKGEMEVKGRKMTVETVPGGYYAIKMADDSVVYGEKVRVRVFMQRYQYQRFEKFEVPVDGKNGKLFRTVMANSFQSGDLKDNYGGFNCGRPGGYIKDYDKLQGPLRDIVKNTKRVMVVFGIAELVNPVDQDGNPVENPGPTPFFMRVKNPKSYKAVESLTKAAQKMNRLPIHFWAMFGHDFEMLPNGEPNFFFTTALDGQVDLTLEDQDTVKNFLDWIEYQNRGILMQWDKVHSKDISDEDKELVDQFVNVGTADYDDEIPF